MPVPSRHLPISVTCVALSSDHAILLRTERDERELPGGKLEVGETPEACVTGEIGRGSSRRRAPRT